MAPIAPEHRVVLIRIPQTGPIAEGDDAALYEATRAWWTVGTLRTVRGPAAPEHALAVVKGRVVAAYRIDGWHQRADGRRAFDGVSTGLYLGADVSEYFAPSAQNPLRYVNCSPAVVIAPVDRRELRTTPRVRPLFMDVTAIGDALDAEPLAHLMFGHRELFHTNLLAWFFQTLPAAADAVFTPGVRPGPGVERAVLREDQHLDLQMTWPGRERLVVEAKVFSVYSNTQLQEYAPVVSAWGEPARLVLLSTTPPTNDPHWTDGSLHHAHEPGLTPWTHLGFDTLAARIEASLAAESDSYEVQTMRHYARLARLLQQLMDVTQVQSLEEEADLPADVAARIPSDQLRQAVRRARARQVANLVESEARARGFEGRASSSFANGSPIVDWRLDVADEDGYVAEVGWQLQGGDFRRFASLPHLSGRNIASREARFAYAKARPGWFDFAPLDAALGTRAAPTAPVATPKRPDGFNRFDPDFVYRYKKAPSLSVVQLVAATEALAGALRGE